MKRNACFISPLYRHHRYAIPKYVLHKWSDLRNGEDFSHGTIWNRKRVKAYQLLWQTDPIHRSLTNMDEKKIPKELVLKIFKCTSRVCPSLFLSIYLSIYYSLCC